VFISTYIIRCRGAVREDGRCDGQSQSQHNHKFAVKSRERRHQDVAETPVTLCTYCFRIKDPLTLVTWIMTSDHRKQEALIAVACGANIYPVFYSPKIDHVYLNLMGNSWPGLLLTFYRALVL
jgi:hypothetical protein